MNIILVTGWTYGLLGALILYLSHRSVCATATDLVAGYPRVLAKLRVKRLDARFGLGVLACGLVLQGLAACGYSASLPFWRYFAVIALPAFLMYALRRFAVGRHALAARAESSVRKPGKRVYETRRSFRLREAALAEAPGLYALEQSFERRLGSRRLTAGQAAG